MMNEKKHLLPVFWTRFGLAVLVMLIALAVNKYSLRSKFIAAKDCLGGKCSPKTEASISGNENYYYPQENFSFEPGSFYRIIFKKKSDQDTLIILNLSGEGGQKMELAEINIKGNDDFTYDTVYFSPTGNFSKVFFAKKNLEDNSNITIENVHVAKLNITKSDDLAKLRPPVIGEVNYRMIDQSQNKDNSYSFSWLKQKKTILGQTFRADGNYLSGIGLNIDVARLGDGGTRQYQLEIQEVSYDGDKIKLVGVPISDFSFSIAQDLEKFRQDDGTFIFPMTTLLEKGKDYMVSLDNAKVDVDDFNYLLLHGSKDDVYKDGTAVVKQGKDVRKIPGDLYFTIYGAKFSSGEGSKVMSGAIIEDLGQGQGEYNYATQGVPEDILDLSYQAPDIRFNDGKKIIFGTAKDNSFFEYKIDTIYPARNFAFQAQQVSAGWNKNRVFYSFDEKNWQELNYSMAASDFSSSESDNASVQEENSDQEINISPDNQKNKIQSFDQNIGNVPVGTKTIFFKITYDPQDAQNGAGHYYGLKNLKVKADLIVK